MMKHGTKGIKNQDPTSIFFPKYKQPFFLLGVYQCLVFEKSEINSTRKKLWWTSDSFFRGIEKMCCINRLRRLHWKNAWSGSNR